MGSDNGQLPTVCASTLHWGPAATVQGQHDEVYMKHELAYGSWLGLLWLVLQE